MFMFPRNGCVRCPSCSFQALARQTRGFGDEVPDPFIVNLNSPVSVDQPVDSALSQNVAEMEGTQAAGIDDDPKGPKAHNRASDFRYPLPDP